MAREAGIDAAVEGPRTRAEVFALAGGQVPHEDRRVVGFTGGMAG